MCAAFTEGVFCLFFIFVKCPLLPELPIPKVTLLTFPIFTIIFYFRALVFPPHNKTGLYNLRA